MPEIFTIGHSTLSIDGLISLLHSFNIERMADVRRFAVSKRYPHFNQEALHSNLYKCGIQYLHFPALGGRRNPRPDSINTAWRAAGFRGYADYMEEETFQVAISTLTHFSVDRRTAIMCAEGPWWKCHRSLISDFLKVEGWKVMHIMQEAKAVEHPFTKAATVKNGKLDYRMNSTLF